MKRMRGMLWGGLAVILGLASLAASGSVGTFVPYEKDDANQRWRDIAANPFIVGNSSTFYDTKDVKVYFEPTAGFFSGRIEGFALKPFFAYQFKLQGKPPLPKAGETWVYSPATIWEHWANEQLGYRGRWWHGVYAPDGAYQTGGNATDADYNAWKQVGFVEKTNNTVTAVHVFFGYLLFDFGITDASGYLYREFLCDSSFHVLFKTSQGAPALNDSEVRYQYVNPSQAPGWYSRAWTPRNVGVYAEWEKGDLSTTSDDRPTPGALTLPTGTFPVELRLTEESFHETASYSGTWATVMKTDISFTLVTVRDAAVLTATPSPSTVAPGGTVNVAVDVANLGTVAGEAIEVSLSCATGGTASGVQTVVLNSRQTSRLNFTWTAPAAALGSYTLTATARLLNAADDNAANDAVSVPVVVAQVPTELKVTAYTLVARQSAANDYAVATVTIKDEWNTAMQGASVTISWTGAVTATQTGTTGANGTVVLTSPKKKNASVNFTGKITKVSTPAIPNNWSAVDGVPLILSVKPL